MTDKMAETLRQKIIDCGLSANQLGPRAGVKQQTISQFLRGHGISLDTADKLAAFFGLRLTPKTK